VGSLTKSMVATVIARLANEGLLSLDDAVTAHVPKLRSSAWAERATLRDLLANRSGLPLRLGLEFGFDDRTDKDDAALSRFVADIPNVEPAGAFWSYSNEGWCVLRRVIETATGMAWEDAMRHHLSSIGLRKTTFGTDAIPSRHAIGHEITEDDPVPVEPMIGRAYAPAGIGVMSTVTDLLRFASVHLEDRSLAALREVHAHVPISGWLDGWCLGWAYFDWAGGPVWGWDGLVSGERAVLRIVPEQRTAIVVMTNSGTGGVMYRALVAELMDAVCGISVPPPNLEPAAGAAGNLSRFAGVYAWPDRHVEVTATAHSLLLKRDRGETEALPLDERTFLVDAADRDNPTVTFGSFDADGHPHVLYLMLWGLPRMAP
jgi:CubicO group peptidase (beta-lactamase class C family)